MKNLFNKKIIITIFALFLVAFPVFAVSTTSGLDTAAEQGYGIDDGASSVNTDVPTIIGKVVGAGLSFIGVLFLLLMIYAGLLWMMARGNEQEVTKAKDLIISAIIGLVIVMSAYAITAYVGTVIGTN
jgi:hypothetical protein